MISIQLPDGSKREYPGPVTVAEVAASIGAGLAKAAVAGRIGQGEGARLVDTSYRIDADATLSIITDKDRRGPGNRPPLDGAPAGLRGERAVPRRTGDDRPGDRERLLLRLRVQAPVHARGPGGDRSSAWRSWRRRTRRSSASVLPRDEAVAYFKRLGEHYKAEIIAGIPAGEEVSLYSEGALHRPVPRPTRAEHGQAQALQADEGGRRVLAR